MNEIYISNKTWNSQMDLQLRFLFTTVTKKKTGLSKNNYIGQILSEVILLTVAVIIIVLSTSILLAQDNLPEQSQSNNLNQATNQQSLSQHPSTTVSSNTTVEEQELLAARKRNELAQAQYYEKLINNPQSSSSSNNQTFTPILTIVVALIALVGALTAARVAYLSFYYNYQNQLRTNFDLRFFETIKQFGNQDSAAARSSAAGMLGILGNTKFPRLDEKTPAFFRSKKGFNVIEAPYYNTALSQLLAGHLLETNPSVLQSIKSALIQLDSLKSQTTIQKLETANIKAQEKLIEALITFFIFRGATDVNKINEQLWTAAASITGIKTDVLKNLRDSFDARTHHPVLPNRRAGIVPDRFAKIFENTKFSLENLQNGADTAFDLHNLKELETEAQRLLTNVELLKLTNINLPSPFSEIK